MFTSLRAHFCQLSALLHWSNTNLLLKGMVRVNELHLSEQCDRIFHLLSSVEGLVMLSAATLWGWFCLSNSLCGCLTSQDTQGHFTVPYAARAVVRCVRAVQNDTFSKWEETRFLLSHQTSWWSSSFIQQTEGQNMKWIYSSKTAKSNQSAIVKMGNSECTFGYIWESTLNPCLHTFVHAEVPIIKHFSKYCTRWQLFQSCSNSSTKVIFHICEHGWLKFILVGGWGMGRRGQILELLSPSLTLWDTVEC